MAWTTRSAIKELKKLIEEVDSLTDQSKFSPDFVRWYLRAGIFLDEVFGGGSSYLLLFTDLGFQASGMHVLEGWDAQASVNRHQHQGFLEDLNRSVGIFKAAMDSANS